MNKLFASSVLICVFCVPNFIQADSSNISGLVFTTESRTVKPGEISGAITVQSVNSGGTAEKVSETNDVTFTSTSPTGEFLNSSGNLATLTMSKNTSSRTVYYRDSIEGVFTLTIEIKGRESGKIFTASQQISVSNDVPSGGDPDGGGTATTTDPGVTSSHSSQTPVSHIDDTFDFKADAGRSRIAYVGIPIEFRADLAEVPNNSGSASYKWSFGDGTEENNKTVEHIYKFTGEYSVVLNVSIDDSDAVSRTEVKVVEPNVSILEVKFGDGGYVKLSNNSEYETNLGNWIIQYGRDEKVIPDDTIVKENSSVIFPYEFESNGDPVELLYPTEKIAYFYGGVDLTNSFQAREQISVAEQELVKLTKILVAMKSNQANLANFATLNARTNISIPIDVASETLDFTWASSSESEYDDQTAALINAFDDGDQGFANKMFDISKQGINFIMNMITP